MARTCLILILILSQGLPALADCDTIATPQSAPKTSKPPGIDTNAKALLQESKVQPFGCRREFVYQDQVTPVDSFNKQDGERLRPVIKDVPSAVSQLNTYQRNRRAATTANYVGSIGLGLALLGILVSRQLSDDGAQTVVRNVSLFSGLVITAGSLAYRFTILQSNEGHLTQAVENYNEARPKDRIEMQINAQMSF